ncbi:MAG TPA: hypothetical protein VMC79_12745, partial [Rectinemataceae bacterium]|nr:hypothetical protein [Rectinemataceae bacterium]
MSRKNCGSIMLLALVCAVLFMASCTMGDLPMRKSLANLGYVWAQKSILSSTAPVSYNFYGNSVAICGNTALVCEPYPTSGGIVHIYSLVGGAWSRTGALPTGSISPSLYGGYGTSVALTDSFAAVGGA